MTAQTLEYTALKDFLHSQLAATIAVPIDAADTIHAAALLYARTESPYAFYFVTGRDTQKVKLLKTQAVVACACVVGTVKDAPFTLQMRGTLTETFLPNELTAKYYQKRGIKHDDINDFKNVALKFTPNWARFIDYAKDYARFMLDVS